MRGATLFLVCVTAVLPNRLSAQQASEAEPNDSFDGANVIRLRDTVRAAVDRNGDVDYYAVDIPAGTKLYLIFLPHFCRGLRLYDRDKQTVLLGRSCHTEHADTMHTTIQNAGRYYLVAYDDDDDPGEREVPPIPYTLSVGVYTAPAGGPGNPMRLVAPAVEPVNAWVGAPTGEIIAFQYPPDGHGKLVRISADGRVSPFAASYVPPAQVWDMAIDAFGDLLVPDGDGVWRYSLSTGERTRVIDHEYQGVAIGADGDIWLSEVTTARGTDISRYDAFGKFKERVSILDLRTFELTMSQSGELFFVSADRDNDARTAIYRLVDNKTPQRVISAPDDGHPFSHLSLDQDGWVYVIQRAQQRMLLYDAQYRLAREPLAQINDSLGWREMFMPLTGAVWLRDQNGKMTDRMLVGLHDGQDNTEPMRILELNHRAMGAPGADPLLHVKQKKLRDASVASAYADTLRVEESGSANWTVVSGALPQGLTLSSNGVITGTPQQQGTASLVVRAENGRRAGFSRLSMTINAAAALQVDATPVRSGALGTSYADTLRVANASGAVTWSIGDGKLPPGISLSSSTGILRGTPTDTGSFAFTATATNATGTASGRFRIVVDAVQVSATDIVTALLGGAALPSATAQFLDLHGNHNGKLDVGDLRAFLRTHDLIAAPAARSGTP